MNGNSLNTPERWGKPGEWVQTPMDANAFTPERWGKPGEWVQTPMDANAFNPEKWGKPGNRKHHQPTKTGKSRETPP